VALINGFSAPLEMWAPQWPALAPEFRVLAYDLRGHGRSDLPLWGYDLATQTEDLLGLLDAVGLTRAHLVGDAAGGGIAVQIALDHPGRVASLTLIGHRIHGWNPPPGSLPAPTPEEEAHARESRRLLREGSQEEIRAHWWQGDWARPMREDPIRRRAARFRDLILSYPGGAWLATIPPQPVPPHYPRLAEIRMPTLVVAGGADMPVITAHAAEWRRCLPHARYVEIPDAGHAPSWEFPEVFNAALLDFLRSTA
jgi:pimeloyl-ACP methyl ester carboxylesterase